MMYCRITSIKISLVENVKLHCQSLQLHRQITCCKMNNITYHHSDTVSGNICVDAQ
jgi:hypothetical protein